jgi:NAD(P)-dependent dehydrogenase (short-subunit alcohol dehydrogenase family)
VSRRTRRSLAALAAGATLGAVAAAGIALLLYTGQGFLRAAGLLVSSTIMAVAAGLWAGGPDPEAPHAPVQSRGRWVALIVALLAGGVFTALWGARAPLRELALGGALAVLLVLALPAYAAGALIVALHSRERAAARAEGGDGAAGSVGAMATAGAAIGVLLATTVLIQNLEAYGIYYAAAGVLTLASLLEWQRTTGAGSMNDHVALITGVGDSGQVGYAVAERFLQAGARVVVTDIGGDVEALAGGLGPESRVAAVRGDLTRDDDIAAVISLVRDRFGRLDSLINVAGGLTLMRPVADTTPEEWERELQRNAGTMLRMSRAALPLLRESGGAIVSFASPTVFAGVAGLGAYSAAKAAVVSLTRALALEEQRHGVRANAIAPGMVDTAQNRRQLGIDTDTDDADGGGADGDGADGGRGGRAAASRRLVARTDVASVALFLAGPDSRGVTGETIHVLGAPPQ